ADEVDADLGRGGVEGPGDGEEPLGVVPGGDRGDRADGDPAVDDRDAVAPLDVLADLAEPAGVVEQSGVDPVAEDGYVGRRTTLQVNAHGDGPDVELVLPDHAERGENVLSAVQRRRPLRDCGS